MAPLVGLPDWCRNQNKGGAFPHGLPVLISRAIFLLDLTMTWSLIWHLIHTLRSDPELPDRNCSDTKKSGSKKPTARCATPPPQTLGTHILTVRFTSMYTCPILSANNLPARSPIQLDPSCNRLSNTRLDTRCDYDHASQMNVLKKIPGFSLSDYVHSPRAQVLPSNFNSSQPEGLIILQNTHTLS
jgi:hypothetical protein